MVLLKKKLIVVSNRAPYSFKNGRYEKTAGGLVTALDPVLRATKGVWITSGPRKAGNAAAPSAPYTLRPVPLGKEDIEGFYNGYSNRFLWPLCHIALDRVLVSHEYWESYRRVNRLFADAVIEESDGRDSVIWLHDYHLALCAAEIKALKPLSVVSLFWHIPWPPHAVFKVCPNRREILKGLLANDLVGFQIDSFGENFMRCAEAELGARVDYKKKLIRYNGQTTLVKAFPISVDFDWFDNAARSERATSFLKKFLGKRGLGRQRLGLGVSRLDYTKGMLRGLDIIELFFKRHPSYRGVITFVHVAVATRKAEPYLSYMRLVKDKVREINRMFSAPGWKPVELVFDKLSHLELSALYRRSELAVICSINDGMNLVAKEYLASQVDLRGALLVSEFTGAAEDIPGAVRINPYDTEASADAIKASLESSPRARRKALELARVHIRKNNIYKWVDAVLRELKRLG